MPTTHNPTGSAPTTTMAGALTTTVRPAPQNRSFAVRVPSTPSGAQQARRSAALRLHSWGYPRDSDVHQRLVLVVAELAANAVTHGCVPGQCVLVRLTEASGVLRVEVSDTHSKQPPVMPEKGAGLAGPEAESGRGLSMVAMLADRCGVRARRGGLPGKTMWADFVADPTDTAAGVGPAAR